MRNKNIALVVVAVLMTSLSLQAVPTNVVHIVRGEKRLDEKAYNQLAMARIKLVQSVKRRQSVIDRAVQTPMHDDEACTALREQVVEMKEELFALQDELKFAVESTPEVKKLVDQQKVEKAKIKALTDQGDAMLREVGK